ncbi:MAG: GDP-L-fucose synthase [Myxococcota bacterium]|nr:GDP-L-fucose synthase [Myxococcota bacterium]MDW8364129.1 GDP-L-fucose synthase [Myxococcales bacterium]
MTARATRFELEGRRVWVAGHRGMVGSALVRRLARERCAVLTVEREELDLRHADRVAAWMLGARPDLVFVAAARVGGIWANATRPAEFLHDNLAIALSVIEGARRAGVERLVFLGSSCIYPRLAPQPMSEDALLTGPLEPTNEAYAVAKIAGVKMCDAYRRQYGCDFFGVMPTNLYGPNDNFDLESSHVVPAMVRRFHEARLSGASTVTLWGTGTPRRELLHVDDLADALVFLARHYDGQGHINVGCGEDVSIAELAHLVADVVGYTGRIEFDASKPDGAPRKLLDVSRIRALGWTPRIGLRDGIEQTYRWYREHGPTARR